MTHLITAVLADDEPLARDALRIRLKPETDIEIIAEARNGTQAVELVRKHHPDLLFLDIQMPGKNGFQVVEEIASEHLPIVVFVTAHDEYALRAFDVHALDYLVKPFTSDRFQTALRRARSEVVKSEDPTTHQRVVDLLDQRHRAQSESPLTSTDVAPILRFAVRHKNKTTLLRAGEVDWIEADGNYVLLHAGARVHTIRMTLTEVDRRLDSAMFTRIHRGIIVRVDQIAAIKPAWHGDYTATLKDGTTLKVTRTYRSRLLPRPRQA